MSERWDLLSSDRKSKQRELVTLCCGLPGEGGSCQRKDTVHQRMRRYCIRWRI